MALVTLLAQLSSMAWILSVGYYYLACLFLQLLFIMLENMENIDGRGFIVEVPRPLLEKERPFKASQVWTEVKSTGTVKMYKESTLNKGKNVITRNSFNAFNISEIVEDVASVSNQQVETTQKSAPELQSLRVEEFSNVEKLVEKKLPGDIVIKAQMEGIVTAQRLDISSSSTLAKFFSLQTPNHQIVQAIVGENRPDIASSEGAKHNSVADIVAAPGCPVAAASVAAMNFSAAAAHCFPASVEKSDVRSSGAENTEIPTDVTSSEQSPVAVQSPRQTAGAAEGFSAAVTAVEPVAGEVKQTWGDRMEAHDLQIANEQKACIALIKDCTTTTEPGKANFSERVAQKEHNEGLPLKQKTKTQVGGTQQTTKEDYDYAKKKIEVPHDQKIYFF